MKVQDIFECLVEEIHTPVVATVNDKNLPVTSVIDMMMTENEKLYFITEKGKKLYIRLLEKDCISLRGIKSEDTLSSISIKVSGFIRDIGSDLLGSVFEKRNYMHVVYPSLDSRKVLTVFE